MDTDFGAFFVKFCSYFPYNAKLCLNGHDHKEGRALRTETTINDTTDFGIGKRLTNLPALREIGTHANRRLLRVQSLGHDPITGADALDTITAALTTGTGTRVPGLRLAERRSHALLQALLTLGCQTNGFTNRDLRALTTALRTKTRGGHRRANHLRPAPTQNPRAHHPHPAQPPLHRHRPRPTHRRVPHLRARPIPAHRTGPPRRPHPLTPYARPPTPTTTLSETSAAQQDSPSNTNHPTQHVKLDSGFQLRRI